MKSLKGYVTTYIPVCAWGPFHRPLSMTLPSKAHSSSSTARWAAGTHDPRRLEPNFWVRAALQAPGFRELAQPRFFSARQSIGSSTRFLLFTAL